MRPPIVTNADRDWALKQCPEWARIGGGYEPVGEIVDDGGWLDREDKEENELLAPDWSEFVSYQIERFEQFFAGQVKTYEDWSNLWRFGWWPKAKPELRFPSLGKKKTEPFYRKGTQGFAIALRLASEDERRMWVRFGIAQFKPDDPRVAKIESAIRREAAE